MSQAVEDFLFGSVADGARDQHDNVGGVDVIDFRVTGLLEDGPDDFRVADVHLAAVDFEVDASAVAVEFVGVIGGAEIGRM